MALPKIAIIGAGPAGLALARILHINGINATIYERDASPNERGQGGTLDLHPATGQNALKKAQIWPEFQKYARYDGEDLIIADETGKIYVDLKGKNTGRPEIDRHNLRQILLDSIPAGVIKWGKKLVRAEIGTLHFEDGSETGFDLIVGADGAWSKIRPLLCHVQPFYSGISGADITIHDVDRKHPEVARLVGRGSMFAYAESQGRTCIGQRLGDGSVRVYVFARLQESWLKECGIDFDNVEESRQKIADMMPTWAPQFKDMVRCGDEFVGRALYMLPVGLRWPSRPGVTVIGDAAHLMTPFAGEGVNVALSDAVKLAESILEQTHDLDVAVKSYQTWMFEHAQEFTQRTWDNLNAGFQEGAIARWQNMFAAYMNAPTNGTKLPEDLKVDAAAVTS